MRAFSFPLLFFLDYMFFLPESGGEVLSFLLALLEDRSNFKEMSKQECSYFPERR